MTGYKRNNLGLIVGHIPERKKPVIMIQRNNCDYVIGQLRSDEDADVFVNMLRYLTGNNEYKDAVMYYLDSYGGGA